MPTFLFSRLSKPQSVQKPYLEADNMPFPDVALRFALACGQMLIYHERFRPSPRQLHLYRAAVAAKADALEPTYLSKVVAEFVKAATACDAHDEVPPDRVAPSEDGNQAEAGSEDLLDAVCLEPSLPVFRSCHLLARVHEHSMLGYTN